MFRIRYTFLVTFILIAILDIGVSQYFNKPNHIFRNEGNNNNAMDYLFRQMEKDSSRYIIAWQGASVMQGLHNAPPLKTYPALVNRFLRKKGIDVNSYNLAVAGNDIGDNYLLAHKSMKCGANIIPVALHYKLFSKNRQKKGMVRYKENLFYLNEATGFSSIRSDLLKVKPFEWTEVWINGTLSRFWNLYRYRKTIWAIVLENGKNPLEHLGFLYSTRSGLAHDAALYGAKINFEDRNADYIWKEIPSSMALVNRLAYKKIDISDNNSVWAIIDKMCKEADKAGVLLLFFHSPVNFEAVKYFDQYQIDDYRKFKLACARHIGNNGQMIIDMSDKVESKFFTDFEHLNMNGHRKLAKEMLVKLREGIKLIKNR